MIEKSENPTATLQTSEPVPLSPLLALRLRVSAV
jgi:hypothetical protein